MFHMGPGGATVKAEIPGQDPAVVERFQASMDRMNQLMESFLQEVQALRGGR